MTKTKKRNKNDKLYLLGLLRELDDDDEDDDLTMTTSSLGWGVVVVVVVVRCEPFLLLFLELELDVPLLLLRWLGALELAVTLGCCTGAAVFKTCNVEEALILCFLFLCARLEEEAAEAVTLVAKTLLVEAVFFSGVTTTAGREFLLFGLKLTTR